MKFYSRRLVMPEHLNSANRLFGGCLLSWIDEEAFIYAKCQLKTPRLVTRHISEVNFIAAAMQDDIVEFGMQTSKIGKTSISITCQVRNKDTGRLIIDIDKIVFVAVDQQGQPIDHGASTSQDILNLV